MSTGTVNNGPASGAPSAHDLAAAVDEVNGGSGGGSLYGANSDVLGATFNTTGLNMLPGLSGTASGRDILQAFLAAGQSDDPAVRNLVAAIEYALYQSGYYSSKKQPNLHTVSGHDAEALGRALLDLSTVDQTTVGATSDGQLQGMSITQFLTSQAALAATSGPGAPGSATTKVKVLRTPNPADVAAEYERVATSVRGSKPTAKETQEFVRQYIQQTIAAETGATAAKYQSAATQAQQPQAPYTYDGGSANAAEYGQDAATGVYRGSPAFSSLYGGGSAGAAEYTQNAVTPDQTLVGAMNTLQDVINANGNQSVVEAQDPESLDTAAANYARNAHPGKAAANDLGNTLEDFFAILGGIGQ